MQNKLKQTILIVDDVPANIDVLSYILEEEYSLKVALNGYKAIEIAKTDPAPDLILLDVMMPDLDGFEVCRILKSDPHTSRIPVIFVTAKDTDIDEEKGLSLGGDDYISKPVSPPIVKARIKNQLALYNQNRALEKKVQERTEELDQTRLEIIRRLGRAAEYKDNETGMHVIRMSHYCRIIAKGYGLDDEEADLLLNAAPMHDIGKIGIPDKILLKPAKLSEEEWVQMKQHCEIGARIIGNHNNKLLKTAQMLALTHHEKWDGSGYPRGLKREEIPLYSRIIAIADVFDALTSKRPYKRKWSFDEAITYMKTQVSIHFDANLFEVFLDNIDKVRAIAEEFPDIYEENGR